MSKVFTGMFRLRLLVVASLVQRVGRPMYHSTLTMAVLGVAGGTLDL